MHFYMSSHWSLHIKHDGRTQLNMSHFHVMQHHFRRRRALLPPYKDGQTLSCFLSVGKGSEPPKLLVVSPDCAIT